MGTFHHARREAGIALANNSKVEVTVNDIMRIHRMMGHKWEEHHKNLRSAKQAYGNTLRQLTREGHFVSHFAIGSYPMEQSYMPARLPRVSNVSSPPTRTTAVAEIVAAYRRVTAKESVTLSS